LSYDAFGGVPNLRIGADARTERVRKFYEVAPFPGYPPRDSLRALRTRAERSEFVRLLDEAIPGDARILDVGCGTGQMSLYLARVPGPKFSPPESDPNRQASPTESATRVRSFRHPLPQATCGSGTRLTATRQSVVDFKSKVKYYFSLDVVVVGPCGLRE
jgi:SAM-dependent methyltransferase